jgi:very-short-patch-repair endonuclease
MENYYFLDVGNDDLRFAVEYDGEEFHGEPQREHDEARRTWITDQQGWVIRVVRKQNIQGPGRDIERILREGVAEARRRPSPR